jgi:hypothetical protein
MQHEQELTAAAALRLLQQSTSGAGSLLLYFRSAFYQGLRLCPVL